MFGGPPIPERASDNREAVGSYALAHEMAAIHERLFATPGQVVQLDVLCPGCGEANLKGKANKYTRSLNLSCPNCTFQVNR